MEEQSIGAFSEETTSNAARCLRTEGALILERIVDVALIRDARQTFVKKYHRYLSGQRPDDALEVGDGRIMITINVEPPFDKPELFANIWLLRVLRAAFDDEFVLGGYGIVCSLPGAETQHRHRDGGILFPQSGLDRLLPVSAVTVGIPLIEMNELHGTTELWLGSHRDSDHLVKPIAEKKGDTPIVNEGSCVVWDYRLVHGGTPNHGTVPRPLLYLTYCRPWFLDHLNYQKQPLLCVSKRWLKTLSDEHKRLMARTTAHWLPETS